MDFYTIGSSLGLISALKHAGQGTFMLLRHFKLVSTCCGARSSIEFNLNTPTNQSPLIKNETDSRSSQSGQ